MYRCDKCKKSFNRRHEGCVAKDTTLCQDCLDSLKEKMRNTNPKLAKKLDELAEIKRSEYIWPELGDWDQEVMAMASSCCAFTPYLDEISAELERIEQEKDQARAEREEFENNIMRRIEEFESELELNP